MKCFVSGFLLLGTVGGLSYVPPAGNQPGFLEVLQDIFLGKELKDYHYCGQTSVMPPKENGEKVKR